MSGLSEEQKQELEKRIPRAVFLVLISSPRKISKKHAERELTQFLLNLISSTIAIDLLKDSSTGVIKA